MRVSLLSRLGLSHLRINKGRGPPLGWSYTGEGRPSGVDLLSPLSLDHGTPRRAGRTPRRYFRWAFFQLFQPPVGTAETLILFSCRRSSISRKRNCFSRVRVTKMHFFIWCMSVLIERRRIHSIDFLSLCHDRVYLFCHRNLIKAGLVFQIDWVHHFDQLWLRLFLSTQGF